LIGESLFATLIQNAGLLLVLVVVLDLLTFQRTYHNRIVVLVGIGALLGLIGSVTMLNAWEFAPGIVFDTRSVVLAITGLFFGWIPTLVAVTLTIATRLYLGGGAALTGILVIVAAAAIGLAWRYQRNHRIADLTLGEFYVFGVAVHGVMLGLMFTLPLTVAVAVLNHITLPILVVYPVVTALVAALLRNRLRGERDRRALSENEERLRLATDAAGQGLYDLDVRSGQINVNDEYARLVGEQPNGFEETLSKWTERLHAEDRERVIANLNDYLSGVVDNYQIEFRQRRAGGGWNWILSVGRIVARDAHGEPVRMTGTNTDITRLKEAEENAEQARREADNLLASSNRSRRALMSLSEDLRESDARFRKLFNVAPVPLFHVDASGIILNFNERFETTFGYRDEDISTLDAWFNQTCEDAIERERLTNLAHMVTAAVVSTQTRVRCRTGKIIDCVLSLARDGENMLGALYDISDRVAAEATRDLQARRAEGLLELPRVGDQLDEQVLITNALALIAKLTASTDSFLYVVDETNGTLERVPGRHPDPAGKLHGKTIALKDSAVLREVVERRTPVTHEGLPLGDSVLLPDSEELNDWPSFRLSKMIAWCSLPEWQTNRSPMLISTWKHFNWSPMKPGVRCNTIGRSSNCTSCRRLWNKAPKVSLSPISRVKSSTSTRHSSV
jgi:PAS domain S-box-containing protein